MSWLKTWVNEWRRTAQIALEFHRGFRFFTVSRGKTPLVAVFGSARLGAHSPEYGIARELSFRLGKAGFGILTGGGPAIMQAGNEGARAAGALSLACNIVLPREQQPNNSIDRMMTMKNFFSRKTMLIHFSSAFVIFAGGVGTLDELFEIMTLMQTGKIPRSPIFLMGSEFWRGMDTWMRESLYSRGTIDQQTLGLYKIVDDIDEVVRELSQHYKSAKPRT